MSLVKTMNLVAPTLTVPLPFAAGNIFDRGFVRFWDTGKLYKILAKYHVQDWLEQQSVIENHGGGNE